MPLTNSYLTTHADALAPNSELTHFASFKMWHHIDGLVHERRNSNVLAMEPRLPRTIPSIYSSEMLSPNFIQMPRGCITSNLAAHPRPKKSSPNNSLQKKNCNGHETISENSPKAKKPLCDTNRIGCWRIHNKIPHMPLPLCFATNAHLLPPFNPSTDQNLWIHTRIITMHFDVPP